MSEPEVEEVMKDVCPVCGCQLGESPYKQGEVYYCCKACAVGDPCECGCCEVVPKEEMDKKC